MVEQYQQEHDVPALEIAAALAKMTLGDQPLLLEPDPPPRRSHETATKTRSGRREPRRDRKRAPPAADMERFRIEVGHVHGVKPGNIVGAIANEAGLEGRHIGAIEIESEFSLIDLPVGMPREVFQDLKKVWVCGQQLGISRVGEGDDGASPRPVAKRKSKPKAKPGKKSRKKKAR
jgi:ATP-dependent RNA helicase DeaD